MSVTVFKTCYSSKNRRISSCHQNTRCHGGSKLRFSVSHHRTRQIATFGLFTPSASLRRQIKASHRSLFAMYLPRSFLASGSVTIRNDTSCLPLCPAFHKDEHRNGNFWSRQHCIGVENKTHQHTAASSRPHVLSRFAHKIDDK
jgi:hypothetical protein